MKKIFLFAIIGAFLFVACDDDGKGTDKEQTEDNKLGCITGKITLFNTGSVTDAYVRLSASKNGEALFSELIELNGDYTIKNVQEGTYFFKVYKQGFVDTLFNQTIKIQSKTLTGGSCRQMDWAISKLPPHLYVVEINTENVIHTLDFGNLDDRLHFQIYNNSGKTYTWWSDFEEVKLNKKWLNALTYSSGTLAPNETKNITMVIDRFELDVGQNTAKILLDSDNGGGWVLNIAVNR